MQVTYGWMLYFPLYVAKLFRPKTVRNA